MTRVDADVSRSDVSHSSHGSTIRLEWGNGSFLQADLFVLRSLLVLPSLARGP